MLKVNCDICGKGMKNGLLETDLLGFHGQDGPRPNEWRWLHYKCDPNPDRYTYFIRLPQITTIEARNEWVRHLAEKRWWNPNTWDVAMSRAEWIR